MASGLRGSTAIARSCSAWDPKAPTSSPAATAFPQVPATSSQTKSPAKVEALLPTSANTRFGAAGVTASSILPMLAAGMSGRGGSIAHVAPLSADLKRPRRVASRKALLAAKKIAALVGLATPPAVGTGRSTDQGG